jgi:hypothetical protein
VRRIQLAINWVQAAHGIAQERQERDANKPQTPAPTYKKDSSVYLELLNVKSARAPKRLEWLHAKYRVSRQMDSHNHELNVEGQVYLLFM